VLALSAALVVAGCTGGRGGRRGGTPGADGGNMDLGRVDDAAVDLGGGEDGGGTPQDAGDEDLGVDAGTPDLGFDAGRDLGADLGSDLGFDAGRDLGADLGSDLGFDAGRDLGADLGSDLGVDAGRDLGTDLGSDLGGPPIGARLVLSEIASGGPLGAADEFIELYNASATPIALGGIRVEYRAAAGASWILLETLPAGASIPAYGYYLLGGSEYGWSVTPDLPGAFTNALAGAGGHVRLLAADGETVYDLCGWGTASMGEGGTTAPGGLSGAQTRERKANRFSTSETMAAFGADATRGNGWDTDDNGADWVLREVADPQNRFSPREYP
jgi:hypothetical protein